jgi:hypothetical protein
MAHHYNCSGPGSSWSSSVAVTRSPVGRCASEEFLIVGEVPSVLRCIHSRFGDGLGCPSSNREYRDGDCWLISARGRCTALSRCRPHSLDEKLWACRGSSWSTIGSSF